MEQQTTSKREPEFYVRGYGEFPMDMLRYDQCAFASKTAENCALGEGMDRIHRVVGIRFVDSWKRQYGPTHARWDSFGWKVLTREEEMREPVCRASA